MAALSFPGRAGQPPSPARPRTLANASVPGRAPSHSPPAAAPGFLPLAVFPGRHTLRLLHGQAGEESLVRLLPGVLVLLQLLDLPLQPLDLGLLVVELLEVAGVDRRGRRQLLEVGPDPPLVLADRLQLALPLLQLALGLVQSPAQLQRLLDGLLD